jgi:inhibitor of cysteine peptidase
MKFLALWLSVALILGMVRVAGAELCEKCKGKMYTQDIGTCTQCGGHTSSGAFKLCGKCSAKLHQCQHCLAPLGTPADAAAQPPPPAATAEKPAEKPAEKTAEQAAEKTAALELTADHDGKTVAVPAGKQIVVRLAGNPTTGFSWKVGKISGEAVQAQGGPAYVADKHRPGIVGSGGTFVFKLLAAKEGKSTVKLVYLRPWEKDKPPIRTFTATIEVGKK